MTTSLVQPNPGSDADAGQFATISVSALRVGIRLRAPIYEAREDRNVLLLSAGTTITKAQLAKIQGRGISRVRVHRSELKRLTSSGGGGISASAAQAVRRAEAQPERSADGGRLHAADAFVHKVERHGPISYDRHKVGEFTKVFDKSIDQVELLFDGLASGDVANAAQMAAVSSDALLKIAEDLDLFVSMGIQPAVDKYPCKHSLQTSMLAMSIGTLLGLKQDELIELGIGCLIHDAGMLHLNPDLVRSDKVLGQIEFLEITKHPIITYELMQDIHDIPLGSRMVAYQMHERCDGSGYPRQRQANQIHHLAKIAAVADVFIALISPRPHRAGMLPYHAMELVIHEARNGLFDKAVVRGLLHTVSLFPIGSCVEMSDGRVGKVVRANRDSYTRPVVELWNPDLLEGEGELVDLANTPDLQIARVLPHLESYSSTATTATTEEHGTVEEEFWE